MKADGLVRAMTTLLGSSEMRLDGTVDPPLWCASFLGAIVQLGTLWYVWAHHSPLGPCVGSPAACFGGGNTSGTATAAVINQDPAWGRLLLLLQPFALLVWLLSLRGHCRAGAERYADPTLVDRLWSLLPWLFCWYFGACSGFRNHRVVLMCVLSTLWGVRLTYNFAIKGGFSGGEDYRWKETRGWFPGWRYELFACVFIHFFQLNLLLAFSSPVVAAYYSNVPLGWLDALATALFLSLLGFEAVADEEMYGFQSEKYRRRAAQQPLGAEYERGFITTGLWSLSRHPNYFAEVSLWWAFYLFSVAALGSVLNWTLWGALFLSILFLAPGASLDVTEALTSRKYDTYPQYQQAVSRCIPWWGTPPWHRTQGSASLH